MYGVNRAITDIGLSSVARIRLCYQRGATRIDPRQGSPIPAACMQLITRLVELSDLSRVFP
jgi:hypothetical protein